MMIMIMMVNIEVKSKSFRIFPHTTKISLKTVHNLIQFERVDDFVRHMTKSGWTLPISEISI